MKKTILSVAVATTLGLTMGVAQAESAAPSPIYNGENCKATLTGAPDTAGYTGEEIQVVCTTDNGAFVLTGKKYDDGQGGIDWDMDRGGVSQYENEQGKLTLVGINEAFEHHNPDVPDNLKVAFVEDNEGNKVVKGIYNDEGEDYGFTIKVDEHGNGTLTYERQALDGSKKVVEKTIEDGEIIGGSPIVDPIQGREELKKHLEGKRGNRGIDTVDDVLAGLNAISAHLGNDNTFTYEGDSTFKRSDGATFTVEDAKKFILAKAQETLPEPITPPEDIEQPPFISPIGDIEVSRDAIKQWFADTDVKNHAEFADWVKYRKNNEDKFEFSAEQKLAALNKLTATDNNATRFVVVESADGKTRLVDTSTGYEMTEDHVQAAFKMIREEAQHRANGDVGINPPPAELEPMPIFAPDKEKFAQSVKNLIAVGQESKAKLQAGAQGIKAGTEDLTEAGQTLKTDLTAGKAELEAAAQTATEQMAAQFAAMQAQLDEQAKLIAELQAGENPSVPSTGISPEAESALRDASATLQAKMDVAVNKLQGAAKTLQEKGSKLAPQDPDFGINPPSQGVPTHELGSIGEGQAVAYVQNGLEELYNTGNEQAQQYADKALSDAKSYTDTQIAGINSRIDGIEEDLETVMATSQAVTAARPYLSSNQTNAIGVGLGNSGSQNAIAVGYAHRINENWTANANLSGTSGNEVDYSVGAGLSYAW